MHNGLKIIVGVFGGMALLYIVGYFVLVGKFGPLPRIGSKKGGYGTVYKTAFAKPLYEPPADIWSASKTAKDEELR